jgi:hypothetical protein
MKGAEKPFHVTSQKLRVILTGCIFERPDVQKAYNNPAVKSSDYNINLGPVNQHGEYTILLGNLYPNLQSICTSAFILRISE